MVSDKAMKAIHLDAFLSASTPFTNLQPASIPVPKPQTDEVLVRITHVSIQQVDLLYARGKHQNNNLKRGHIHPPFTLGLDFAGIVIAAPTSRSSQGGKSFHKGSRVFGSNVGSFAEYIAAPASSLQLVPGQLALRDAAALVSGVVSFAAIDELAEVKAGQKVLVTGVPGNLAVVAAQCAAARGAKVFALARNAKRADSIRTKLPGVVVLASDGKWTDTIRGETASRGIDVVIDNVGMVKESLGVLTFGGIIVLVGFAGRGGNMEAVEMNRVLLKGARVVGYRFGEGIRRGLFDQARCWHGYMQALNRGDITAIVDDKIYQGLEDVGRAMEDLEKGQLAGKAVVEIAREDLMAKL